MTDDLRRSFAVFSETFSELVSDADDTRREIAQVTVASSLTMSAGLVAWLLRGGALAASLMTALPAWSSFDPIPVVARRRERRQDLTAGTDNDATEAAIARVLRPDQRPRPPARS